MRQSSARPYTPLEAEGRGMLGNNINFIGRGGRWSLGRRGIAINMAQTVEAMPRRQY
jgi:hypothetical protein